MSNPFHHSAVRQVSTIDLDNILLSVLLHDRGRSDVYQLAKISLLRYNLTSQLIGDWPSGKALGSGPRIGGSNPSSPAKQDLTRYTTPY
jgi:hypothetical protein